MKIQICLILIAAAAAATLIESDGGAGPRKDQKLIETTCRNTPDYELCMSIIEADPKSKEKVLQELALTVVAHVKKTSEETLATIDKLLKSVPKEMEQPLLDCNNLYHVVLDVDVPLAERATWGNPKFAETAMADAKLEAEICEQAFKEEGPSLLTHENKYMGEIASIARGIIRNLL